MTSAPLIAKDSPLRRLARLPRFRLLRLCILVVRNDYHVQAECIGALRRMGHRVVEIRLGVHGKTVSPSDNLAAVLSAVIEHRPDMLLSINYTGFDRVNWMGEAIDAVGLPTAIWLVDSPFFMAQGYLALHSPHVALFTWDQSYVQVLRRHGAHNVFHLPLGTCTQTFAPDVHATQAPTLHKSFVGHTLMILERRWRGRLDADEIATGEAMAQRLEQSRGALHEQVHSFGPPIDRNALVLAFANMVASKRYRSAQLEAVADRHLHLFGDVDWKRMLPQAHAHGAVAYGSELCRLFQRTAININATNLQMPSTVNQRVFDVPASGAFLLTDKQAEMEALFEPDVEMSTFQSPEELRDKAAYFARHATERTQMVARALRRVRAEHTYEARLGTLLARMRGLYGRSPTAQRPALRPQAPSKTV